MAILHYQEAYYSVGFDFGTGNLLGFLPQPKDGNYWKVHQISQPFKGTYAATFYQAKHDIFFIDMEKAMESEVASFFSTQKKQLLLGGPGYTTKKSMILLNKRYDQLYDGLIFIKNISTPIYQP